MRRILAATLGMAALASLAPAQPRAPQRGPAPQKREASVPFRVGETLTYDVAWSTYLIAGTAVTSVVEKKPSYGSTAYYIVAEGRPLPLIARLYALYYKMDTLLDSVTTLSQRSSLYTQEGTRHRTATTRFDRTSRRALFELQADGTAHDEFAIPPEVQDGLAALYTLRTRTFKAGERLTMPVADDGVLYSLSVEATGPERLKMRLGEFDAWNLQMTVLDPDRKQVGKNMAIWMSTDSRRLPLRMQADLPVGYFVLALKDAR
jgi:uncharacterized protein DUF3108